MDLKQWAEREGLAYYSADDGEQDEHSVIEMAYEMKHCINCSDIFVFRATLDGALRRYTRIGDVESVVLTDGARLETLHRADFEPPKHVVLADEDLMELAAQMVRHMMSYRNNRVEHARLASGDIVEILLTAAVALGRHIGQDDEVMVDMLDDVLDGYGQPDPHSMQMSRTQ